jgi:two-component system cell cycle response regulator CtrA
MIVSGMSEIENKVRGLTYGADDYMTKPFHGDEMVARIHAVVRRVRGYAQSEIIVGCLRVNIDTHMAYINDNWVHLTDTEYRMLQTLVLRKDLIITKEMFLNTLYGGMDEPEAKTIEMHMCKLRKKLASASGGKSFIETIRGCGYKLKMPEEVQATATFHNNGFVAAAAE